MNRYLYIPISYLEKINITKKDFLQNASNVEDFLQKLLSQISLYVQVKQTLLVYDYFVLILELKNQIHFKNGHVFHEFMNYIRTTNFKNNIIVGNSENEIIIKPNTSDIFYNILNEFIIS